MTLLRAICPLIVIGTSQIARAQPAQLEFEQVDDLMNRAVFVTGAAAFAISYGIAVGTAASTDRKSNNQLYYPIAGPFIALHKREDCHDLTVTCDHELTAKILLVVDGAFQVAGLIGMIDAFLEPTHHDVTRVVYDTQIHVRPTYGSGPGLALVGRF